MQTDTALLPERLDRSTFYIIVRLMRIGYREANKVFGNQRLRLMHYAAAAYVDAVGSLSQKELSQCLLIDPSDLAKLLDDLEKEGYLVREVDSRDRRRHKVSLSASGRHWLQARDKLATRFDETFFEKLAKEEKEALRTILLKIT